MIQLVTGSMAAGILDRLQSGESGLLESESTLLCLPGEAAAAAILGFQPVAKVLGLAALKAAIIGPLPGNALSRQECQLILKRMLLENRKWMRALFPGDAQSDILESNAAMTMIYARVMKHLKVDLESEELDFEPLDSARERALALLVNEFRGLLETHELTVTESAQNNAVLGLSRKKWEHIFFGVETIVFAFHDAFDELTKLLVKRLGRLDLRVVMVFPYDPEQADNRYPHMAPVFDQLIDLANEHRHDSDFQLEAATKNWFHVELPSQVSEPAMVLNLILQAKARDPIGSVLLVMPGGGGYPRRIASHLEAYGIATLAADRCRYTDNPVGHFLKICLRWLENRDRATTRSLLNQMAFRCLLPDYLQTHAEKTAVNIERLLMGEIGAEIRHLTVKEVGDKTGRLRPEDLALSHEELGQVLDVLAALEDYHQKISDCKNAADSADAFDDLIDRIEHDYANGSMGTRAAILIHELRRATQRARRLDAALFSGACNFAQFATAILALIDGRMQSISLASRPAIRIVDMADAPGLTADTIIVCGVVDGLVPDYRGATPAWSGQAGNGEHWLSRRRYWFDQCLNAGRAETWLLSFKRVDQLEALPSQFFNDFPDDAFQSVSHLDLMRLDRPETRVVPGHAVSWGQVHDVPAAAGQISWNRAAEQIRAEGNALSMFDGVLSRPELRKLLARKFENRTWSATGLGRLVSCPFQYWSEHVLALAPASGEPSDHAVDAGDTGVLVHAILEQFFRTLTGEKAKKYVTPENFQMAAGLMLSVTDDVLGARKLLPFAGQVTERRLLGLGGREEFVNSIAQAAAAPGDNDPSFGLLGSVLLAELDRYQKFGDALATPRAFELSFGGEDNPVELIMGPETVPVRGCIDRMDVAGNLALVIDYKTGAVPSSEEILEGRTPQMPLYTAAVRALWGDQYHVGGGLYFGLDVSATDVSGRYLQKSFQAAGGISSRCKAIEDDEFQVAENQVFDAMGRTIAAARHAAMHHTLAEKNMPCTYCEYSEFCRKNLARQQPLARAMRELL